MTGNWIKETKPVDDLHTAIYLFTEAYNHMQQALALYKVDSGIHMEISEALREAVVKPVYLSEEKIWQICLYEIGIAHSPNREQTGLLAVHEEKLGKAFGKRENEITTLFIKESEGLLPRLCALLTDFLQLPGEEAEGVAPPEEAGEFKESETTTPEKNEIELADTLGKN